MAALFEEWTAKTGTIDRVPAGWEAAIDQDPNEQLLGDAGFEYVGSFDFSVEQSWTMEMLTGFVYSTSLLNREALGDRIGEFERAVTETLVPFGPDGTFELVANYSYELARRPY